MGRDGVSVHEIKMEDRGHSSYQKKRRSKKKVALVQGSSLPPSVDERDERKADRYGFAQKSGDKEEKGFCVGPFLAVGFKIEKSVNCQKKEKKAKQVFSFRDPGDGFDLNRMDRE